MKAIIALSEIKKIELYIAKRQKTVVQIKAETGADYIINGGLFDMSYKDRPLLWLRANGKTLSTDKYGYWCYGWNDNDIKVIHSNEITNYRNAICCTTMIKDGFKTRMMYESAQGSVRGRSAIGLTDNSLVLYCSKDGTSEARSPESLQNYMSSLGCKSAIMLDSGGSCSGDFDGMKITTSRKCHNYILVYLNKKQPTTTNQTPQITCPYREPTTLIRYNSRGEGAKWTQWQLNRHGDNLTVDGIFGKMSLLALKLFQKDKGLVADGLSGSATRAKLKE